MKILDIPRLVPKNAAYISIPIYHAAHLSIDDGMEVHLCLLPGKTYKGAPGIPELIVAPFDFHKWDRMWRLVGSFKERSGILHDVADALRRSGVNILVAETNFIEEEKLYQIEMLIELHDEQKVGDVTWALQAKLLEDISFTHDERPNLRISRLQGLFHAKRAFDNLTKMAGYLDPDIAVEPVKDKATIRSVITSTNQRELRAVLDSGSVRQVLKQLVYGPSRSRDGYDWGYLFRVSDTKDRFLRVLFFKSRDPIIHAVLEHKDRIGALADVTGALADEKFNILTSLHRPAPKGHRSRLELLVRKEDIEEGDAGLKVALEHALSVSPAARDLDIKISYPIRYGRVDEQRKILPIEEDDTEIQSEPRWIPQLYADVAKYEAVLTARSKTRDLEADDKLKLALASKLVTLYSRRSGLPRPKILFVSCQFRTHVERETIIRLATELNLPVVTAHETQEYRSINEGVLAKMRLCTHYLGVWSRDGLISVGNEQWPSPWFHWELGAAEARGLDWHLLIDEKVPEDAWKRIHGHKQHTFFNLTNFELKCREVLQMLVDQPDKEVPGIQHAVVEHRHVPDMDNYRTQNID